MVETDSKTTSDSNTDETDDEESNQTETIKVELRACDLEVKAQAENEDFEKVFNHCSRELQSIMRHHLVGEMEVMEEEEIHSILLG